MSPPQNESRPRFVPERPFPAYAFVPGRSPHPISDPRGHSFGHRPALAQPPDPSRWTECGDYLYGLDLFNHGYYWEAHEVWESLWHACERIGPTADFLKGLIKLAAAGVKFREGQPRGVAGHAARAAELLRRANVGEQFLGLRIAELLEDCRRAEARADAARLDEQTVLPVFDFVLLPHFPLVEP